MYETLPLMGNDRQCTVESPGLWKLIFFEIPTIGGNNEIFPFYKSYDYRKRPVTVTDCKCDKLGNEIWGIFHSIRNASKMRREVKNGSALKGELLSVLNVPRFSLSTCHVQNTI